MSNAVDPEAEAVIRQIQTAFAGVRRGGVTLHETDVIDMYGSERERRLARMLDTDERWEQVPDEHIEACTTGLSFFDPESWRYYIAPFMIWALRHLGKTNLFVLDSTIYTFDPSEKHPELAEYAMERFSLLNESQSRAVCCFLRFMARNGDYADDRVARDALRKYWGTFCPDDSV